MTWGEPYPRTHGPGDASGEQHAYQGWKGENTMSTKPHETEVAAEWEITDADPYMTTYSCTEHLSEMMTATTARIDRYDGSELCLFVSSDKV